MSTDPNIRQNLVNLEFSLVLSAVSSISQTTNQSIAQVDVYTETEAYVPPKCEQNFDKFANIGNKISILGLYVDKR